MIDAQIDYTLVEPLPYKKTLCYVNNFIINTTQFLNRFSYLCEQKLGKVSRDIQRLEITMSILEAKLNSIPELEGTVPTSAPSAPSTSPLEDHTTGSRPLFLYLYLSSLILFSMFRSPKCRRHGNHYSCRRISGPYCFRRKTTYRFQHHLP